MPDGEKLHPLEDGVTMQVGPGSNSESVFSGAVCCSGSAARAGQRQSDAADDIPADRSGYRVACCFICIGRLIITTATGHYQNTAKQDERNDQTRRIEFIIRPFFGPFFPLLQLADRPTLRRSRIGSIFLEVIRSLC